MRKRSVRTYTCMSRNNYAWVNLKRKWGNTE